MIKDIFNKLKQLTVNTGTVAAIISLFTALVFNGDFFRTIASNISADANGALILVSMTVMLFTINFFTSYLLLRFTGYVGKAVISVILLINSGVLYAMNSFHAMIDDRMIGNVLHTTTSEVTNFFSLPLVFYILLLGVLPTAMLWMVNIRKDSLKRTLISIFGAITVMGGITSVNTQNFLWVDRNVPVFGSQIMPWCYIVNIFRYYNIERRANEKENPLPDARVVDEDRCAVVLVIGESARRQNFQLYGYERPTNPLLSTVPELKLYQAQSVAANTIDAVRAILTRQQESELHEILPNYLFRHDCDVMWNTSNWGEPTVHIDNYNKRDEIAARTGMDPRYDECLFSTVKEFIQHSDKDKVLAVVHMYTSHGPAYYESYPPEFEAFTPTCKTVEVAKSPREDLVNAYDNTILYTDWMLYGLINDLKAIKGRKCAMIFLSDHGESLGENGRYLHGTGIGTMEEKIQEYEIPFFAWTNNPAQTYRDTCTVDQHFVFHSVMDFLGFEGEVFEPSKSIFRQ